MFNPCRSALATLPNAFISPYHLIGSTFRPPSFRPINTCQSPQKYTTTSFPVTTTPTCVWVETSAAVTIEMPPEEAYDYYTDLEAMPKWSPWLKSVIVDEQDGDVSRWTLASRGITISWKARNTQVRRGEIIAWKSETGLTNRGKVIFRKQPNHQCTVTLAVEFDVPEAIATLMKNEFITNFVEKTLLADMKRFRSVALLNKRKSLNANC